MEDPTDSLVSTTADVGVYRFVPGQAAIVTEIYLPAKYAISPHFLTALDDSLSPERVEVHFSDNRLEPQIKHFLPPTLRERYADLRDRIKKSPRSFGGYSVYDLKGAWTTDTMDIERDANACVRIIDWPTPEAEVLFPTEPALCQRVIRIVFALRQHHDARPEISSILQVDQDAVDEICQWLDRWIDEGSFLLYGFLMYHLGQITAEHESEILLTSHFTVINRYRRKGTSPQFTRGAVTPRTEEAVFSNIKCRPEKMVIGPGQPPRTVAVIIEAPTTNIRSWAFGYDPEVVAVAPAEATVDHGVAEFTIGGRRTGATTVSFTATGADTCKCDVVVTNANPKEFVTGAQQGLPNALEPSSPKK